MLDSVLGVYRDGKVELAELPEGAREESPLERNEVDLRAHGLNEAQAAELRARLSTFADEWDQPEMNIYDDYAAAKSRR